MKTEILKMYAYNIVVENQIDLPCNNESKFIPSKKVSNKPIKKKK